MLHFQPILYALLLLTSNRLVVAAASDGVTHLDKREDVVAAPLMGMDGPLPEDVKQSGNWYSSWFCSVAVAMANSRPEDLKKSWTDTGVGNGEIGKDTDSADFYIWTVDGVMRSINIKWKNIKVIGRADFNRENPKWWIAGLQHAALIVGGWNGLKEDVMDKGNPADAFKMLTNKDAEVFDYQATKDNEKLRTILKTAKRKPVVYSYLDVQDREMWLAVLEFDETTVTYYSYEKIERVGFDKFTENLQKVAHWKV